MNNEKLLNLLAKRHKKQFKRYRQLMRRKQLRLLDLQRMETLAEAMAATNSQRRRIAKKLGLPIVYM